MNPFPVPVRRTPGSAEFFDFAARGALLLRQCPSCSVVRGPQERFCPSCHAEESVALAALGTGRLVSWCVVHRSPVPGLEVPYTAAIVECDEGPWVLLRLLGGESATLRVGAAIELVTAVTGEEEVGEEDGGGGLGESIVAARIVQEGIR
jgi:uncharacterized OB-fold protein